MTSKITATIGNTPLLKLSNLSPANGGLVFAKQESRNPMGSVKCRIAVSMIEAAEQLAGAQEQTIVDAAIANMTQVQQTELQRLRALAEINPNIRQEEIKHLSDETVNLQHYLDSAHIKLEAVRVAVVTD